MLNSFDELSYPDYKQSPLFQPQTTVLPIPQTRPSHTHRRNQTWQESLTNSNFQNKYYDISPNRRVSQNCQHCQYHSLTPNFVCHCEQQLWEEFLQFKMMQQRKSMCCCSKGHLIPAHHH